MVFFYVSRASDQSLVSDRNVIHEITVPVGELADLVGGTGSKFFQGSFGPGSLSEDR